MKVYVVTEGEYSDFHIEAIFARKADAEAVAERKRGGVFGSYGGASVDEWEVLGSVSPVMVYTRRWAPAQVGPNWTTPETEDFPVEYLWWPWEDNKPAAVKVIDDQHGVHVRGTDKARVDKAYQDRVAKRRAILAGVA